MLALGELLRKPLKEQARKSDMMIATHISDVEFLQEQLKKMEPEDETTFWNVNSTTIGNMVTVMLHGPTVEIREQMGNHYQQYRDWYFRVEMRYYWWWKVWDWLYPSAPSTVIMHPSSSIQ